MNSTSIRQKLHHYIETANDKKVKAIFAMVEDEIEETYDYWADADFIAMLKKRESTYLNKTSRNFSHSQLISDSKKLLKRK